jgi:hypothetical protein
MHIDNKALMDLIMSHGAHMELQGPRWGKAIVGHQTIEAEMVNKELPNENTQKAGIDYRKQ